MKFSALNAEINIVSSSYNFQIILFLLSLNSREANVSFRNSSHKAKNIYARADNNNPQGVAHNRNRY